MSQRLQDQARGLKMKMQMLAISPGFIDTETTEGVREFYEWWRATNMELTTAGYEDSEGTLTFVDEQLGRLLGNFPASKTTIGVLEVFPLSAAFLYGCYVVKLGEIASTRAIPA